jgi:hypothetical protein
VVNTLLIEKNTENWQTQLDVKQLAVGTYVVTMRMGATQYTGRFVKH